MAKVSLNNLSSWANQTSAMATINNNNDAIEAAMEKTLSRDGTAPNTMGANLDMNSNRILNLPAPTAATEPMRLGDVATAMSINTALDIVSLPTSTDIVNDEADWLVRYDISGAAYNKFQQQYLGFTAAGAGATLRNMRTKIREIRSITDFGAVSGSDCATAITAALTYMNSLGGGLLFFPVGTWLSSTGGHLLEGASGTEIVGEHWTKTAIGLTASVNTFFFKATAGRNTFRNLTIHGAGMHGLVTPTTAPGSIDPSAHTIWFESTSVDNVIDQCFVRGGYACVMNEAADTLITNNSVVTYGYGPGNIVVQASGCYINRCKLDQQWPVAYPGLGVTAAARANTTAYLVNDVVTFSNFYWQCSVAGTSGGSTPTAKGYGQSVTDGTVTWLLVAPVASSVVLLDTAASQTHILNTDMTGCTHNGVATANSGAGTVPNFTHIDQCTISQQIDDGIDMTLGSNLRVHGLEGSAGILAGTSVIKFSGSWIGYSNIDDSFLFGTVAATSIGVNIGAGVQNHVSNMQAGGLDKVVNVANNMTDFSVISGNFGATALHSNNDEGVVIGTGCNRYTIAHIKTNGASTAALTDGSATTATSRTVFDVGNGASVTTDSFKTSSSGGLGYSTGAGGAVTQITDKTTTVVLNKICGQITTVNTVMNANTETGFTVTNSTVAATDTVVVSIASGATANAYQICVDAVGAGSFHIALSNPSASNLSEVLVINFAVIKGVAA